MIFEGRQTMTYQMMYSNIGLRFRETVPLKRQSHVSWYFLKFKLCFVTKALTVEKVRSCMRLSLYPQPGPTYDSVGQSVLYSVTKRIVPTKEYG